MIDVAGILKGVATFRDNGHATVAQLSRAYGRATLDRVRGLPAIAGKYEQLVCDAPAVLARSGVECWSPAFGRANELAAGSVELHPLAFTQAVLALAGLGWSGDATLNVGAGGTLLLQHFQVRVNGTVVITSRDGRIDIISDGDVMHFERKSKELYLVNAPIAVQSSTFGIPITFGYAIDPELVRPSDIPINESGMAAAKQSIEAAIDLLSELGSGAVSWVLQAVRQISAVGANSSHGFVGRSVSMRPGHIVTSAPHHPVLIAETLVHESSHQMFNLCRCLGPYVRDGGGDRMFCSAINGRQRTIDRVALALHAMANMYMLFDEIVASEHEYSEIARARLRNFSQVALSLARTVSEEMELFTDLSREFIENIVDVTLMIHGKHHLDNAEVLC
ncbi:aKG-HExxH-type peptide beta-hydroxylase [Sphingomonas pokkalii]|uniref:HEXXH motif domain-containing protein n=1 Tax=Sphingomonas pokkalii TaxID=2175090 RepID=A0A2U0SBV7_9SPHN|nr:HEXXH motif-containing putative peptide modification protein [Sphingomonas pokkalii]PVX28849.1 hypothetical protein DD559_05490 [Sphingomonas pokkalii]